MILDALKASSCWAIFEKSILDYHIHDNVDKSVEIPSKATPLESLLYQKNWVDTVQWHLEDLVRAPQIPDHEIAELKRRIDRSNQVRTDLVEKIDDWIVDYFRQVKAKPSARLNTETPAWVIDRLSILALKIFHMKEQVERSEATAEHRSKCETKLNVLLDQKVDLCKSFDDLLEEISSGDKRIKVYRQMKMYNDESLNPMLYGNKQKSQCMS